MSKHFASAVWRGNLPKGNGKYTLSSSGFKDSYTFHSRFEDGQKSSPEELIGAALASCFSMALAGSIDKNGGNPESIETDAEVILAKTGDSFSITEIHLNTRGKASGIDHDQFIKLANDAKENCPVSRALGEVNVKLEAELI
jgi:osmotically inducible protein OsmC